ncbi:hypothetical protein [Achromobacter xylosoxidans]|uniref:hypothetical protein n=1 Tax=Alcaligenes xylosoxydans xylosoxydans TaxID=85698 RepID=UPI001F12A858|nr:hypothetical protein [Achromobacter xylosoxidans]
MLINGPNRPNKYSPVVIHMPHKFTVGNASLHREGIDVKLKSLILKTKIECQRKPRLGIVKCQDMAHWFSCDEVIKKNESGNQGVRRDQEGALISTFETSGDKEKLCGKLPTM